ncbi:hypothetical protein OQA88_8103 [Cercophora sp. LCS_1]
MTSSSPPQNKTSANPPLTPLEQLRLILKLLFLAPPQIALNTLRCLTLAYTRSIPLTHYARCAFNRFALGSLTPRELQGIQPPSASLYTRWAKSRARRALASPTNPSGLETRAALLKPDVIPLPDGQSSLLWVGDRSRATKFVYFFHGGGYVCPLLPGHLEWCLRAYVAAAQAHEGEEVAVAVLAYTLSPPAKYPAQLVQAVAGLKWLLESGIRPGDLVIGGDSAGGNLTAQVLGHLLHRHPEAEEIVLGDKLAGAFLVSPWVSGRVEGGSYARNGGIDMLSGGFIKDGVENLVGGSVCQAEMEGGNVWCWPVDGDCEKWFTGLDEVVEMVYVTVGAQEVFLDQGVEFAEAVRRGNPGLDVKLEISKNEAHDWILLEGGAGEDGDAMVRMRNWATTAFWG